MAFCTARILPPFLHSSVDPSSSYCKGRSSSASSFVIPIRAGLKQKQQQQHHNQKKRSSAAGPLPTAEDLASRLRLEMAVADLERLFREAGPVDPPNADSCDGSDGRPVLRVAYQGVRGSYCHEAATTATSNKAFFPSLIKASTYGREPLIPCGNTMEDAFSVLEDGSAHRAIIPAENSIDGPIDRNLDLLLRHPAVQIVGELVLPVNHCLLSLPGVQTSALRRVVSHPQALSHCENRLRTLDLEVEEVSNAADAARFVAENRISDTAVIGSKIAGEEFGLQILEHHFQDDGANIFNRFLQLGVGPGSAAGHGVGPRKTTVAFSLERGVSDLFRAMWMFESRGVRVSRVDHRPNRSKPVRVVEREGAGEVASLDYVFVLDLEGSGSDPSVEAALERLGEIAPFVRVLGSYSCSSITL